jgi:hypothetical protein
MSKIYLKTLIGIVVLLWIIYFIQEYKYNYNTDKETFTPKINSMYRPYVRKINQTCEHFVNNYGPNIIANKLRKWNIY